MTSHRHLKRRISGLLVAVLAVGYATATVSPAFAYSGSMAASYADAYAITPNVPTYPVFGSDCTNFVSQAVNYGGYPFRQFASNGDSDLAWWIEDSGRNSFTWSDSWAVSAGYYNFLVADDPGGYTQGTAPGSSNNDFTPDSVVTGDVLFYDWGQGEGISHAAIQVGIGTDPNMYPNQVWYGNYVDEHTNNRYHAFWSLLPYNSEWATTTIYFMHISADN